LSSNILNKPKERDKNQKELTKHVDGRGNDQSAKNEFRVMRELNFVHCCWPNFALGAISLS
jgi:hypothetical protein